MTAARNLADLIAALIVIACSIVILIRTRPDNSETIRIETIRLADGDHLVATTTGVSVEACHRLKVELSAALGQDVIVLPDSVRLVAITDPEETRP